MDRILVDTNIVLDLLLKREQFFEDAQNLFTEADRGQVKLFISSLTIANIHYVLSRSLKSDDSRRALLQFKVIVEVLPLDDKILELALASEFTDFEDGIQYYTAIENQLDIIITRNKKDFKKSALPVLTAGEYSAK